MRLIRFILIIGITTCTNFAFSQTINKNESSSIRLELDKTEYAQLDTIKLRITNLSMDTFLITNPYFRTDCIKLKIEKEKEWEQLIIQRRSGGIHPGARQHFLPNQVINFEWTQKYLNSTNEKPSNQEFGSKGTYIFEFHFTTLRNDSNSSKKSHVSYSEEFKIK